MKLKSGFIISELGDDALLVPVGGSVGAFHGFVRLNDTAAFIVKRLERDTSAEEITEAVLAEYDVEPSAARAHVEAALEKLQALHALER